MKEKRKNNTERIEKIENILYYIVRYFPHATTLIGTIVCIVLMLCHIMSVGLGISIIIALVVGLAFVF